MYTLNRPFGAATPYLTLCAAVRERKKWITNVSSVSVAHDNLEGVRTCQNLRKCILAITDQNGSPMVPSIEQHILKVDFRDVVERGSIEQVAQDTVGGLEVTNRIHHFFVLLGNPVRGLELLVGNVSDSQLDDNIPANSVSRHTKSHPLANERKKVFGRLGIVHFLHMLFFFRCPDLFTWALIFTV